MVCKVLNDVSKNAKVYKYTEWYSFRILAFDFGTKITILILMEILETLAPEIFLSYENTIYYAPRIFQPL